LFFDVLISSYSSGGFSEAMTLDFGKLTIKIGSSATVVDLKTGKTV
jgi:hypothetical protein